MHHAHRTWFPFILVGLTLALALGLYAVYTDPGQEGLSGVPVLTQEEYEQATAQIFTRYTQEKHAQNAYERLLDLRVSAEQKNAHLDLVLFFGKLTASSATASDEELRALLHTYPWLNIQE